LKGRALVKGGRQTEAVEAIADALRIDAAGLPTLLDAAHVLCEADEAERAIRYVDRAVELYPDERDAWFARGRVFETLGERERSEEAYSRAAELEPEQAPWHSNLTGVLAKRGSRGPW
jgi:tetratricopeptide (TPR) repeat protein